MRIEKNRVALIDYTVTSPEGKVIDTSNGRAPLMYLHGMGSIIPGLEKALDGKSAGDEVKVTIPPEEAYGQHDPDMLIPIPRGDFTGVDEVKVGMQFRAGGHEHSRIVTVVKVEEDTVTVDANHPLAGVAVTVEAKVVEVREATEKELNHGHACSGHGSCGHCE